MIVMKFGGTSVKDAAAIDRAAGIVQSRLARRPVVVVSAMSKVTDALIATGKHAGSGELDRALELSRQSARSPLHRDQRSAGDRNLHRTA